MAANTVTFTLGNFCAALAHADFSLFVDGSLVAKKTIHLSEEKEAPTNEELEDSLYMLAREMIQRSGANTKGEVNSVIPLLSITLDYPVVP